MCIRDSTIRVEKSIEAKKLDLNFASEAELLRYFEFLRVPRETAQTLAATIADWRDQNDIARPNGAETRDYVRARDTRRPANRAFHSVSELNQVLGITPELAGCALPGLTIFGEADGPDPSYLSTLYARNYPREQRQSTASLGTAARITNAGGRYSLVARVTRKESREKILNETLGLFRISGNPQNPFEWIVMMEIRESLKTINCNTQNQTN